MPELLADISRAISVFRRENVRVFDFGSASVSEDGIVGTFARQAGLTTASRKFLSSREERANEALSLEATRIFDALNRRQQMFAGGVRTRRAGPKYELPYLRRIGGRKFDIPDSMKEEIRAQSREDVAWPNEEFGLDLYHDIPDSLPREQDHGRPVVAPEDATIASIAGVIGDLVRLEASRRVFDQGETALSRGNLADAAKLLRKATRMDPDARQPKRLLRELAAKRSGDGQP